MSNSDNTRMMIVMGVNLALSGLIGYSIYTGGHTGGSIAKNEPAGKNVAILPLAANRSSSTSDAVSEVLESNQDNLIATASGGALEKSSARSLNSEHNKSKVRTARPDRILPPAQFETAAAIVVPSPPPMISAPTPRLITRPIHRIYSPISKIEGISLTAIMGNNAMLSLRREGSRADDKPEIVCLSAGQKVRTYNNLQISMINVEPNRVTFDIDGDRFVKSLAEIR